MINLANPVLAYFGVFMAGGISSINPCVVVIYPLIISYVGGYAEGDIKKAFWSSLSFVVGLSITYSILGTIAALSGQLLGNIGGFWNFILGGIAIFLGLNLLGIIHFKLSPYKGVKIKQKGILGALFLGLIFGLTASACSTPILGFVLTYVASRQNIIYGGTLLFTYALGSSVIILLVGVSTGFAQASLKAQKLEKISLYFPKIAGMIFILIGLWMIFFSK
ncbi:cytochrome c biogenesis CcdA family protein [Candidatus Margulisiibacteriota bacterium]